MQPSVLSELRLLSSMHFDSRNLLSVEFSEFALRCGGQQFSGHAGEYAVVTHGVLAQSGGQLGAHQVSVAGTAE